MLNKALNTYRYYVPILVGYVYNYTVSQLWVKVSKITSRIARRKGLHEDINNRTYDQVFIIHPQFHSNKLFSNNVGEEKVYRGHNLTSALKNYVE